MINNAYQVLRDRRRANPKSDPKISSMQIHVQDLRVDWATAQYDKSHDLVAIPFRVVIRNSHSHVEDELAKQFPRLMIAQEYGMQDLRDLQIMKAKIRNGVDRRDLTEVAWYFHSKYWFKPYDTRRMCPAAWCVLTDSDCKLWVNEPHLELTCMMYIDIALLLEDMLEHDMLHLEARPAFHRVDYVLMFNKGFPLLLTYGNTTAGHDIVSSVVMKDIHGAYHSDPHMKIAYSLSKKDPAVLKFRDSIRPQWSMAGRMLTITVDHVYRTILEKLYKHRAAVAFVAASLYLLRKKGKK